MTRLLARWKSSAEDVEPDALCAALSAAAYSVERARLSSTLELAWTGPLAGSVTFRRTEQALLQLIQSAQKELLIVTFAAYKVPVVQQKIRNALTRGVRLRFVGESALECGGKVTCDAFEALAPEVADRAHVYIWPQDQRPVDSAGHYGSLHAKCAVADESILFLSSANLTDFAMTLNMEMGLLVRGGELPRQVVAHFDRLIQHGTLVRVASRPG